MIQVLVASQNPVKADAVLEAFEKYFGETVSVALASSHVDSGVGAQPLTLIETALGALNRLAAISGTKGYDYYIAIEGGMYCLVLPAGERWFESACAAVQEPGSQPQVAYGPAYPVPNRFVQHIVAGKDLTQAVEAETGIKDIGKGAGFNGWLTKNTLTRKDSSAQAVLLAIAGLEHADV